MKQLEYSKNILQPNYLVNLYGRRRRHEIIYRIAYRMRNSSDNIIATLFILGFCTADPYRTVY